MPPHQAGPVLRSTAWTVAVTSDVTDTRSLVESGCGARCWVRSARCFPAAWRHAVPPLLPRPRKTPPLRSTCYGNPFPSMSIPTGEQPASCLEAPPNDDLAKGMRAGSLAVACLADVPDGPDPRQECGRRTRRAAQAGAGSSSTNTILSASIGWMRWSRTMACVAPFRRPISRPHIERGNPR